MRLILTVILHAYFSTAIFSQSIYQTVVVCNGNYAYVYHSSSNCPGLFNCKGYKLTVTESTAISTYKRVPCCRCWSNVSGRCKDDNPGYSSGGADGYVQGNSIGTQPVYGGAGGEGEIYVYAAIGAIFIGAGVFLLSNEIYLAPCISLYKAQKKYTNRNVNKSFGKGFIFHLTKNFKQSALEYGVGYIKHTREITEDFFYSTPYTYITTDQEWNFYINYVHNLVDSKLPEKMDLFVGPTINYLHTFGYGVIVGVSYKVLDRIKFDLRYEASTQSNHLQLGVSFLYQKKYLWQK